MAATEAEGERYTTRVMEKLASELTWGEAHMEARINRLFLRALRQEWR